MPETTEQPTAPEHDGSRADAVKTDDGLRTIATGLLAAFEGLGAEHEALTIEEKETTATERRGTVRRMIQAITDASRTLVCAIDQVATVYGLRELGINKQMAKGADGRDYSPLLCLGDPNEELYDTGTYIETAVQYLGEAYRETKKYPALATARHPQEMTTVLSSLRAALAGLRAELAARDRTADSTRFDSCIAALGELENRVCRVLPAQRPELTADDVTAAIRANPAIARAAAAALEQAIGRGAEVPGSRSSTDPADDAAAAVNTQT